MIEITLPWPPTVNTCAGIYRIDDVDSGCFYIGSAANFRRRFDDHLRSFLRGDHPNNRMQRVFNKDRCRLRISVLQEIPGADRATRLAAEQIFLDMAGAGVNKDCFNVLPVAGSHQGAKRTDETKRRLSLAMMGRTFSRETRQLMRAAKLGKSLSLEHRKKIAKASIGRPGPSQSKATIDAFRSYNLTQVLNLRELIAVGKPLTHAAREAGISRATARRIVAGHSYKEFK